MYLTFKALNTSKTGVLTEDEFMDVYSVNKLNWKVSCDEINKSLLFIDIRVRLMKPI